MGASTVAELRTLSKGHKLKTQGKAAQMKSEEPLFGQPHCWFHVDVQGSRWILLWKLLETECEVYPKVSEHPLTESSRFGEKKHGTLTHLERCPTGKGV